MKFFTADLVIFTGEILNGKLHFLCRVRRFIKFHFLFFFIVTFDIFFMWLTKNVKILFIRFIYLCDFLDSAIEFLYLLLTLYHTNLNDNTKDKYGLNYILLLAIKYLPI